MPNESRAQKSLLHGRRSVSKPGGALSSLLSREGGGVSKTVPAHLRAAERRQPLGCRRVGAARSAGGWRPLASSRRGPVRRALNRAHPPALPAPRGGSCIRSSVQPGRVRKLSTLHSQSSESGAAGRRSYPARKSCWRKRGADEANLRRYADAPLKPRHKKRIGGRARRNLDRLLRAGEGESGRTPQKGSDPIPSYKTSLQPVPTQGTGLRQYRLQPMVRRARSPLSRRCRKLSTCRQRGMSLKELSGSDREKWSAFRDVAAHTD